MAPAVQTAVAHLLDRTAFRAALDGPVVSRTAHFALHRARPRPEWPAQPLLGALVPKRWARRAVTRNAIRRQVYAVAAEHADGLDPVGHVVRLRCAFDRSHFVSASSDALRTAVRGELQQLFARARPAAAASGHQSAPTGTAG